MFNLLIPKGGGGSTSPLTTKGDLYTYSSVAARLAVGSNGQILSADSTAATGLKWIAAGAALSGSPASTYVAYFSSATAVTGTSGLTYDGTTLTSARMTMSSTTVCATFGNGEKLQYIAGDLSFTKADDSRCISFGAGGTYFDVHANTMRCDPRIYAFDGVTAYSYLVLDMNADPGAAAAGTIRIGSKATTLSGNSIHLRTEQAVAVDVALASTVSLRIWVNNVEYKLPLTAV